MSTLVLPPKWCGVDNPHNAHEWIEPSGLAGMYRACPGTTFRVTGCMDMEQYATAYNEGYADALRHAESLVRALRPGNNSQMRWQSGRDAAARQINAMRKSGTSVTSPGCPSGWHGPWKDGKCVDCGAPDTRHTSPEATAP